MTKPPKIITVLLFLFLFAGGGIFAINLVFKEEIRIARVDKPFIGNLMSDSIGLGSTVIDYKKDTDNDGIADVMEREIWGTDPENTNTDADSFSDKVEIENGYNPLIGTPATIPTDALTAKKEAEILLTQEIARFDQTDTLFFSGKTGADYNTYEDENGLFRFDYKNTQTLKQDGNLVYLEDLAGGGVTFRIFADRHQFKFSKSDYHCASREDGETMCFSTGVSGGIVMNLELFGRTHTVQRTNLAHISMLGKLPYAYAVKADRYMTRAEAITLVLRLKYPDMDFSTYTKKCFDDVERENAFSPYICYAKEKGIILGMDGKFYPDSVVNIYGILKMLFTVFEVQDLTVDENRLDGKAFEQMTELHYAYPIMAKAPYEGVFTNPRNLNLWPNQAVTESEVYAMTVNFLDWQNGKVLRNYNAPKVVGLTDSPAPVDEKTIGTDGTTGQQRNEVIKKKLDTLGILPHTVAYPAVNLLPKMNVVLRDEDFHDIYVYRTADTEYPAVLTLTYPNGEKIEKSVTIKTRGNAQKGYVKSSYTINAETDFEENKAFEGDEFLDKNDGIKLKGFIADETMIHEKLFYDTFKALGHSAPNYFDVTMMINGVPMGLYQVTEPINKQFFKKRGITTDDYFYAQTLNSAYDTNLKYYVDDATTLAHYKAEGDTKKLLELIHALDANDPKTIWEIDKENVYDYALLTYLTNANDSLTNNYYVYKDTESKKWKIFPWDADICFEDLPVFSLGGFNAYTANDKGRFNNLIRYLFKNLDNTEKNFYLKNFKKKWNNSVDILKEVADYKAKMTPYITYENALWNELHLERPKFVFDTLTAIAELEKGVQKINNFIK